MGSFFGGSSRPSHVYLSFKGDDDTCRFTDMLWASLETDDLNTFWDDKKLHPADSITLPHHFLKAIKQSNVSIVVFSKNYASSIWCLEELSKIAARIHEPRYTVFPVFYGIDPSEVQNQSHSFEIAFAEHEQRFAADSWKVHSWRFAMKQVAYLSGWHVSSDPWPQVIDDIVREVKKKVSELGYLDADLVGMQCRVKDVEKLLDLDSKDEIRVVGICGMGGIGKTILAKVLYDRISHHFDASHFLVNVSEFYKISRMRHLKNILVVVDGIDLRLSLKPMIRIVQSNWLGGRSRIIITTRDEGAIKQFEKHHIYRVQLLTKDEALQLLCRKAFKRDFPVRGYEEQVDSVLQYASGLPLAIVILCQFLYNRRASEWSSSLLEFKKVANSMIMKVLKKSFDELNCDCKEVFLDVACFFIGKEIKLVEGILDSTHIFSYNRYHPGKYDMQLLIEKSLMAIVDQKIQMHGLVQHMGKEIVRHEFPSKPEEWSRLWDFDDIYGVMQNDTATLNVKAMVLELEDSEGSTLRAEILSRMNNLRLLIFRNVKFSGVLKDLSSNLQYISWHQYPFNSLPSSFKPYYLRELILTDSCITRIWDEEKIFERCIKNKWKKGQVFFSLRNMDLRGSKDLTKMPNFEGLPNLERLELEGCTKLSQLDTSIASLSTLKFLNLKNCSNIVIIPNDLFSRHSLEILNLAGCSKFASCLKFYPSDIEGLGERESIQQSFPCKRRKAAIM